MNYSQMVSGSRPYGTGLDIGMLAGRIVSASNQVPAVVRTHRDGVQPYLSLNESQTLDQLLHDMGMLPATTPAPTPTPTPPVPSPAPTVASFGWYNEGWLIGTIVNPGQSNERMIEPASDAPMEVRTSFYTSSLYYDYMSYRVAKTAPYSGGIDFLGDALTQARITASAVTSLYAGALPLPTFSQYLQRLQSELRSRGVTASEAQIAAALENLRAISNGTSTSLQGTAIENDLIVVTGWRPPTGPGFTPPVANGSTVPPAIIGTPPSGTGVTPLTGAALSSLVEKGALTRAELDDIKNDLDGKLTRGEITAAQYDQMAEQRIVAILQNRFPGSGFAEGGNRRSLTAAETYQASLRLGSRLDPAKVRLQNGPGSNIIAWVALKLLGRSAITLGNTIYLNTLPGDMTGSSTYELLLHELGHVAQYQARGFFGYFFNILVGAAQYGSNGAYDYWKRPGVPFSQQPLESQANIIGHLAYYLHFGTLPPEAIRENITIAQLLQFGVGSGVDGR